jgi:hypothetical protein
MPTDETTRPSGLSAPTSPGRRQAPARPGTSRTSVEPRAREAPGVRALPTDEVQEHSPPNRDGQAEVANAERLARTPAFVWATLLSFFAALGGVLVLNTVVDPFALAGTGLVPSAIEIDRSIKLTLIDRLERPPGILILGSSRARQAEPAYLQRLTGRSGFNAAVTGGTAADAWVMTNYVAQKFPLRERGYVWFVDVGIATNGVNPQLSADPRARPYLSGRHGFRLRDVGTYLGTDATAASLRVLEGCALRRCKPKRRIRYLPDGSLVPRSTRNLPEQARSLKRAVRAEVLSIRANPPQKRTVDPRRYVYFERTLRFMNRHGATPVIVLNPVHPAILAELKGYGYPGRKTALAYLRALHARFDFVFVDAVDIRVWHGSPNDFSNANHVNRRNMRRMLTYVVAHSQRALG